MSIPAGAIGEWRLVEDNESRENYTTIWTPKPQGARFFRATRMVTYAIAMDDDVTQAPGVCDPGGLSSGGYVCESRTFMRARDARLTGVYSETWVRRGSWTEYED